MLPDFNYIDGFTQHPIDQTDEESAAAWGRNAFIWKRLLLYNGHPTEWDPTPISGFEKMALLNWVQKKLTEPESQKFVLYYWDFNPENFILRQDGQLMYFCPQDLSDSRVIDWDMVTPRPLTMTTMSLDHRMLLKPTAKREWATNQSSIFQDEIERLERVYPFSPRLSEMYKSQTSSEAVFLCLVIDQMVDIDILRTVNSTLVDTILERSPENLREIASQWHAFTDQFYLSKGRPIPDWPQYISIQEELGIIEKSGNVGSLRQLAQRRLMDVFVMLCARFPDWEWVKQKHCYLTAALELDSYFLLDGGISCVPGA